MLAIQHAVLAYQKFVVSGDLTIELPEGKITAIIGPNGSGKSTLVRALGRVLLPSAGQVLLDGRNIRQWNSNEIAKRLAMLPQAPHAPDGLTVRDLVSFGRFPYRSWFGGATAVDCKPIRKALADVHLTDLAERPVASLSGGQRQRVWIAMCLAQETQYILLDEPTTFLDLSHQLELMDLITRLNAQLGKTIIMVLHDLNLASRFAHHIVAMHDGKVAAQGMPAEVLNADVLRNVFNIEASIIPSGEHGAVVCVPLRSVISAPSIASHITSEFPRPHA